MHIVDSTNDLQYLTSKSRNDTVPQYSLNNTIVDEALCVMDRIDQLYALGLRRFLILDNA